ncbi:MAG: BCCT family transporter [Bacillota bacterium]|nr:BCCT family transporter [Bacillota bacterium]
MKKFQNFGDKKTITASGLICLLFVAWAAFFPKTAEKVLSSILSVFSKDLGWLYLLVVFGFIIFLLYICCSRYGSIKLGQKDAKPEYSGASWFFMLFSAGMGIGLVFWSVAEPMSHYLSPPLLPGGTTAAAKDAMTRTFMHWGLHPWACYAVVGLALAYFQFNRKQPALLSSCFIPLVGEKKANGSLGVCINVLAIVATIFGVASSLGMGAMQINSGLNYVFGIPYGVIPVIIIIIVISSLFIASSVSGIDRGMKNLSNANIVVAIILITFVFIEGNTLFSLNFITESAGNYLGALIPASFWTDTFNEAPGWLGSWTVFYWAWWISWTPFVGGFIARISKGRTIREFIVGVLLCPTVFCFLFMGIMGGNAIYLDMNGVTNIAAAIDSDVSFALFALLENYPLPTFFSILTIILICAFFITSADSATLVCAMMTSKGSGDPPTAIKIFWGLILSAMAIILLLRGGLTALQSAAIAVALPFALVCLGLMASLLQALKEDSH